MIPITTKEQFFEAKKAAEQMTEIHLFGAIYLVRGVKFDTHTGRGEVDVMEVGLARFEDKLDREWRGRMGGDADTGHRL